MAQDISEIKIMKLEELNLQKKLLVLAVIALIMGGCATSGNPWQEVTTTSPGQAEAVGFYTAGCLDGGVPLAFDGSGYQLMRLSRKRFFAHPNMVQFIEDLGEQLNNSKIGTILIGDLAQPRGGPTMSGHISHQTGLDADLWYWLKSPASKRKLTMDERESLSAPTVLTSNRQSLRPDQWTNSHRFILKSAAENDEVERIFVHPVIKQDLCSTAGSDRAWLSKIRPWWGHHDHFHVRLRCPQSGQDCRPQSPPELSDGCGEDLKWWFSKEAEEQRRTRSSKTSEPKMPKLPRECRKVLRNTSL